MRKVLVLFLMMMLAVNASAEEWTVGFAQRDIPVDLENETYYVAGYRSDWPAAGVLDLQQAHAVILDDNSGKGCVALLSVDCVALGAGTVEDIRNRLSDFAEQTGCRAIHITATHDHAGADTLGLWGPLGKDGKNARFMEDLKNACVQAVRDAYDNRTNGELYFGSIDTGNAIQEDTRKPVCFDSNLYCFRFVPSDKTKPAVRMVNYATHAESLDGANNLISADFPAYVAQYIKEAEGSELVWFPGAIGGLIRTQFILVDRVQNCYETARLITKRLLAIDNEVKLAPSLEHRNLRFSVKCENPVFWSMKALGILDAKARLSGKGIMIDTEMSRLDIGGIPILMMPGEIFPEVIYPALNEAYGDNLLIFGLTDDEIGYVVPENDFLINESAPYVERIRDASGEDHYEETNSVGPAAEKAILDAARKLKEQ